MRVIGIVFFLISMMGLDLQSQTKLGLKFGPNATSLDYAGNKRTIRGIPYTKEFKAFHLGLTSSVKLSKKFALALDLFYIGKGNDRAIFQGSTYLLENTIALPFLLKYNAISRFSLLIGIESNYEFSYYDVKAFEIDKIPRHYVTQSDIKFQFGYVIGVAYDIDKTWALDFRYVRIHDNRKSFDSPVYNRTFMLSVHRFFGQNYKVFDTRLRL